MNSCLICGKKNLKKVKTIDNHLVLECSTCKLSLTKDKSTSDINKLYQTGGYYVEDEYISDSYHQNNKINWLVQSINDSIVPGKVLEVGAGFGLLASRLSNNPNYTLDIIEPYLPLSYIKSNRSITKHKMTYEEFLKQTDNQYTAVMFIDVLEHFPNPHIIISKTLSILATQGKVVVNLPNYKSLMQSIVKNWSWWMVDDHFYHFSPKSLSKFFKSNGYEVEKITTYESFIDFKKNLDGNFIHIKNPIIRKFAKGVFFSVFIPLYFMFRKIFWKLGYGGLIFMVARKK